MQTRLDNAFAALQNALLSLERTIDERQSDFMPAQQPRQHGEISENAAHPPALNDEVRAAMVAELTELKKIVGEAGAVILDIQNNQGTG